jgi:hypothetical protein
MAIRATTRDLASGVEGGLQEFGVHPGDTNHVAGMYGVGPERRLIDRRDTSDEATGGRPLPFAGDRRLGDGHPNCSERSPAPLTCFRAFRLGVRLEGRVA